MCSDPGMNPWGSDFPHKFSGQLSECRDLVEVPGGSEWKIRRLIESDPHFYWKYSGTSSIVQYHFDVVTSSRNETVIESKSVHGAAGDAPVLPVFYATLPYFISPHEISVQPKYLEKVRANMTFNMNTAYTNGSYTFSDDQLFVPVACACKVDNQWFRGRLKNIYGTTNALVELVDFGTDKIMLLSSLAPLLSRFGRVPPMALRCRVKDVYINDLDTAKVEEFKCIIADTGNIVRVELCNTVEPYFVNLYHPTVHGLNLGKLFYRPPPDSQREEAKIRKWNDHVRRQNCEDDDDFDSDYDDEEEEDYSEPPVEYIRTFERSSKATRADSEPFLISHIENSRLIYVQTGWMIEERSKIEERLDAEWITLLPLPMTWMAHGSACAVRVSDGYRRATIVNILADAVIVFLVDHGSHVRVLLADIRAIPFDELLAAHPMLYVVGLDDSSRIYPHPSETAILRQILPVGSVVKFHPDKKHKRIPMRGTILTNGGSDDVRCILNARMTAERVDALCRAVVFYNPTTVHNSINSNFEHHLFCPDSLVKGTLSTLPLPNV